ncbi:MAG TPA: glycosyltransferase [Candidatus Acidoferrum sp.]|nr:glycosyltransferase [Candidatus Acidoferrum sp.]
MPVSVFEFAVFFTAAIPFIFYLLAIYSSGRYFRQTRKDSGRNADFTPPVSNLKPVRGLDPEAYENFASFCRQDYPEYELIFCATDQTDPSVPVIQKLMKDFPERKIRLLYSTGHTAINDKVAKLRLMEREAQHEYLVINDSDVRVDGEYLRRVVEPLRDPQVGGVTCFYVSPKEKTFVDRLQTIGMISDFYAGVLVAWQLDGVHFALGPTMVSTKQRVKGFGGFQVLENRPADDLLFGRLITEQGVEVRLLPQAVETVPDYQGIGELLTKRVRWMTVMRAMRPWGHFGLIFTWGLPWTSLAVLLHPTLSVAAAYWGAYLVCRVAMTWVIGIKGLRQRGIWGKMALIPVWDALAFLIWLVSFLRTSIRWRGVDYQLQKGQFVRSTERLVAESSGKGDS